MRPLLILLMVIVTAACSQGESLEKRQIYTFGTLVDVTLYGVEHDQAQRLFEQVNQELDRMQQAWQPWQGSGELAQLNRQLEGGGQQAVSEELLTMLESATELSEQSGGLFNPAIGQLVRLWGFHQEQASKAPPPEEWIKDLVAAAPNMQALILEKEKVSSRNGAVAIDLGAFAKGYGVDRVIELLKAAGVEHAIVNAGGDLRAFGRKGERPWRIGVKKPRGKGVLASIEIEGDESIFTSGDYERFFTVGGRRYHHIIDPRTGYPAGKVTSVTVIHSSAAVADAATTALFVAGPEQMPLVAKRMGVSHVMMIDDQGQVFMTPSMEQRIQFEETKPSAIWVTNP